jgi:hypothetical protein
LSACFLGPKSGPVLINCPRILCVIVDWNKQVVASSNLPVQSIGHECN